MQLKLDKKRVVVAISNEITFDEFIPALLNYSDALAIKMHAATVTYLLMHGINPIEEAHKQGLLFFIDEKFDEVPSEVEKCARRWQSLGVDMITATFNGGRRMLEAARRGADQICLLGVTVLTTMDKNECLCTFGTSNVTELVLSRTRVIEAAGLDGTVCAPSDLSTLQARGVNLQDKIRLLPNIRFDSETVSNDDQNSTRSLGPAEVGKLCRRTGLMVIGRPIYQSTDPAAEIRKANSLFWSDDTLQWALCNIVIK